MTQNFRALQQALRNNPDLPLTWDQAISLDSTFDANPELKRQTIEALERIQATETGQRMLREMILREGYNGPVSATVSSETGASLANYDNYRNLFKINPDIINPDSLRGTGRTVDQYLAHELGHPATMTPTSFRDAQMRTKLDEHLRIGEFEGRAEAYSRSYAEESGNPLDQPYEGTQQYEAMVDMIKGGMMPKEALLPYLVPRVLKEAKIDGLTDAQAIERLDDEVERLRADENIDVRQQVYDYLRQPAPAVNELDEFVVPKSNEPSEPEPPRDPSRSNTAPTSPDANRPATELNFN
ncbi:MAG: hypothetical protein AB7E85_02065 [Pseudobdellovibrionaceae bacterium]